MTWRVLARLLRALDAVEVAHWRREASILDSLRTMSAEWLARERGRW